MGDQKESVQVITYGGVRIEAVSWTGLSSGWSVVGYRSSTRINIRGIREPPAKGQVMRDVIRTGRQSVLITLFSSSTFVSYVPVS